MTWYLESDSQAQESTVAQATAATPLTALKVGEAPFGSSVDAHSITADATATVAGINAGFATIGAAVRKYVYS
jgi:hypothetical protein